MTKRYLRVGLLALLVLATAALAGSEFPLRQDYSEVTPITTGELQKILSTAIVVDARNSAEYDVIHVLGAHNLLVGKMKKEDLLGLRALKSDQPLVFYCNGTTCSKSYKASKKAIIWGFENVFVYDAGVFEWAQANPEKTEFFGKAMTKESLSSKIIAPDKFKSRCLKSDEFADKALSGEYAIFDIRDRKERNENQMLLPDTKKTTLDEFVTFLEKGVIPKSKLLLFGNVGKQSRWIQYYLEKYGHTDYFFLTGGVRQWQADGFGSNGIQLSATD